MANGGENSGRPDQPSAPPPNALDERYYVRGETEAYGPYDGRALKEMIERGEVLPTSGIARVGETQWIEVKDHPYFGSLRRTGSSAPQGGQSMRLPGAPGHDAGTARGQLRYAGFWIRFAAYLIDTVFMFLLLIVPAIVFGIVFGIFAAAAGGTSKGNEPAVVLGVILLYAVMIVIVILYQVLTLGGRWQATPGKRLLGLYVITLSGEPVSKWRAVGRYLCYSVSAAVLYIGFMMIGWTKEKRGFHDSICDTRVVYGKL
ncbi:MAG: RDD family protein [Beijerinckiaceae bacterium]